jgi:hypothetical protein
MSKMDDLRAMREARYAARTGASAATRPAMPARRTPPATSTPEPVATDSAPEVMACGHRNMSGRTCTREKGHAAKSHRYS